MKIYNTFKFLILFSFLVNFPLLALVDYTDNEISNYQPDGGGQVQTVQKVVRKSPPRKSGRGLGPKWLSITPFYESLSIQSSSEGDVAFTGVDLELRTQSSIYIKANYYQAASSSEELTPGGSYQQGNPEILVGLNWLDLGGVKDGARFDLIAGGRIKESEGTFATSRNDKIVGIETSKPFGNFVFGIGFHYTITGNPENDEELAIGNVTNYKVALGWFATPDIRFSFETNIYEVSESSTEERINRLEESLSFSSVSPKLYLTLSPAINLVMGGVFRTRKLDLNKNIDYLSARLYPFEGAYGNSLFASLGFSI